MKNAGPAASLIDFGFAVKLPLCEEIDRAYGLSGSIFSFTSILWFCYDMRRPSFVALDVVYGFDQRKR